MKKLNMWITGAGALTLGIWLLGGGVVDLVRNGGLWAWRGQTVLLSGVAALVAMTLCMIIAVRPKWLDRSMGGLDKAYLLHKWSGIAVVVTLSLHFLAENLPKWLRDAGWFTPPPKKAPAVSFPDWLLPAHHAAKGIAEWVFYIAVALCLVALLKRVPWRYFLMLHKAFPVVFMLGAFHSVFIQPMQWWTTPAAALVVVVAGAGTVCALWSLFQQTGRSRQQAAVVRDVRQPGQGLVDFDLQLAGGGILHRAGQFVFVRLAPEEEAHPFTIASPGQQGQHMRFVVKALGDFTSRLPQLLRQGQPVRVEGPYGQFDFRSHQPRQVWVAGGVGVTPFLARLRALAGGGSHDAAPHTDFWLCARTHADIRAYDESLPELCRRAGVQLHLVVEEDGQRLKAQDIVAAVGDMRRASVWFCGPAAFGQSLRRGLEENGMRSEDFHREIFSMR